MSQSGHHFHCSQLGNYSLKFTSGESSQPSHLQLTLPFNLCKSGSTDTSELVCSPWDLRLALRAYVGDRDGPQGKADSGKRRNGLQKNHPDCAQAELGKPLRCVSGNNEATSSLLEGLLCWICSYRSTSNPVLQTDSSWGAVLRKPSSVSPFPILHFLCMHPWI